MKSGVDATKCTSTAYVNRRDESRNNAVKHAWKTLFIVVLLVGSSIVFMWDAEFMVVEPLERMYGLVRRLANNPLQALAQTEVAKADDFETVILEKLLPKLVVCCK